MSVVRLLPPPAAARPHLQQLLALPVPPASADVGRRADMQLLLLLPVHQQSMF